MSEQRESLPKSSDPEPGGARGAPLPPANGVEAPSGSGKGTGRWVLVLGGTLLVLLLLATLGLAYRVRQLDDDIEGLEAHLRGGARQLEDDGQLSRDVPAPFGPGYGGPGRFGEGPGGGEMPMPPGHHDQPGSTGPPWEGPPEGSPAPGDHPDGDDREEDRDEGSDSEREDRPGWWNPDEGDREEDR